MDKKEQLVRMLNYIYTQNYGDIKRIYKRYNPTFALEYSFLELPEEDPDKKRNTHDVLSQMDKADSIEKYL
jgi:hypothetical protein